MVKSIFIYKDWEFVRFKTTRYKPRNYLAKILGSKRQKLLTEFYVDIVRWIQQNVSDYFQEKNSFLLDNKTIEQTRLKIQCEVAESIAFETKQIWKP